MSSSKWIAVGALVGAGCLGFAFAGCGSEETNTTPGPDAAADTGPELPPGVGQRDDGGTCKLVGGDCTDTAECCTDTCDPNVKKCATAPGKCGAEGAPCGAGNQCCTYA